jgi:DNA-binding MarR family transcriptional regulator
LSVLTNVVSGAIASVYQQRFGLTIPEWRVIAVLVRHPGLSAAEVATHTRMDAVAVSRAVSRLLRSGRIRRSMSASDRRRSVLQVSPDGEAMYREIAPLALRYEQDLLVGLRGPELAVLDSVLDKLMKRAQSLASAAQRDAATHRPGPGKRSSAARMKRD